MLDLILGSELLVLFMHQLLLLLPQFFQFLPSLNLLNAQLLPFLHITASFAQLYISLIRHEDSINKHTHTQCIH